METWFEAGHVAIVTGASRGLGHELARELLERGLNLIIDGRDAMALAYASAELRRVGHVVAIAGDVSDQRHAHELVDAAKKLGRLDLLINNASTLGEVPLPRVDQLTSATFARLFDVNVYGPIHLMQHSIRVMRETASLGTIVNVTSDAAVEAYPTWGGYGATKAALEHVSHVLAAEMPDERIRVLVADPGDMNTRMHRDAVPDADVSRLRDPALSARALLHAIEHMRQPFERVRLAELVSA